MSMDISRPTKADRQTLTEKSPSQKGAGSEGSIGEALATCRRKTSINTVLKSLGLGKMDPGTVQIAGGKDKPPPSATRRPLSVGKRTLGVSLLGGCSSKGCPTKSEENEDRFVHGKIKVDTKGIRGLENSSAAASCWAFATFDGHAGPACSHFLKENFMTHLQKSNENRSNIFMSGEDQRQSRKSGVMEVVMARLLTETLASLTRTFEMEALSSGEISGACVIAGLYCHGALVLANIGDCQAVYHGEVKSSPGAPVTAQTTIHDVSNSAEVERFLSAGGFISSTGRFQGVLEPSRTIGDVDVKADAPKGSLASFPELFKVDIASEVMNDEEGPRIPPFLVLATDGIWDEASANTVVSEIKDGINKIQAHKRRFSSKKHRREWSGGSMTFTDGESDTEDEASEFCGSGQWAGRGMDLAERVVSLARGRYDDATALVVVFE